MANDYNDLIEAIGDSVTDGAGRDIDVRQMIGAAVAGVMRAANTGFVRYYSDFGTGQPVIGSDGTFMGGHKPINPKYQAEIRTDIAQAVRDVVGLWWTSLQTSHTHYRFRAKYVRILKGGGVGVTRTFRRYLPRTTTDREIRDLLQSEQGHRIAIVKIERDTFGPSVGRTILDISAEYSSGKGARPAGVWERTDEHGHEPLVKYKARTGIFKPYGSFAEAADAEGIAEADGVDRSNPVRPSLESSEQVQKIIGMDLSEAERRILEVFANGHNVTETANIVQTSKANVSQTMRRIREKAAQHAA